MGGLADVRLVDEIGLTAARKRLGRARVQLAMEAAIQTVVTLAGFRALEMEVGDDDDEDAHEDGDDDGELVLAE